MTKRDDRQQAVHKWVRETFGERTLALEERVMRVLEEAAELAQAEGLTRVKALAIIEHVFNKPDGDPMQEAGGVGVTLLAYCAARGISAELAEDMEFKRVQSIDPARFRERQNVKAAVGIGIHTGDSLHARAVDCSGVCPHCGKAYPLMGSVIFPHYLPSKTQPLCPGSNQPPTAAS